MTEKILRWLEAENVVSVQKYLVDDSWKNADKTGSTSKIRWHGTYIYNWKNSNSSAAHERRPSEVIRTVKL